MLLNQLAHARTGDKGNIVTISLIAYRQNDFGLLEQAPPSASPPIFQNSSKAPFTATRSRSSAP